MLSDQSVLVAILDYIARGAVLVLVFMLRWLFVLDKKFDLLEQDLEHQKELAEAEAARRDQQRDEILTLVKEHKTALESHNDAVLTELRKIAGDG